MFAEGLQKAQALSVDAFQAVIGAAAGKRLYEPEDALQMKYTLISHADLLSLNLSAFNQLHAFAQDWVAMRMIDRATSQPFTDALSIRNAFAAEVEAAEKKFLFAYTNYSISLRDMVDRQMSRGPQTDLYTGAWQLAEIGRAHV